IMFRGSHIEARLDESNLIMFSITEPVNGEGGEVAVETNVERRGIRGILASAIAAIISNGAITSAAAQEDGGATIEEISVTGSRIRMTSGMTTPTPVTA